MKNPRKPTRKQKELLKKLRLNPANWLVCSKQVPGKLVIVHRYTGHTREIAV